MAVPIEPESGNNVVSITPLLRRLWPSPSTENVTAAEVAGAIALIFTHSLSDVQAGALLTALHFTGWDRKADVLRECARSMIAASSKVDIRALKVVISKKGRKEGKYNGGLCDIVGTGGDSHNTFNISTTASIIASAFLTIAKHGNRASTSKSGAADLLVSTTPPAVINAVTPSTIQDIYEVSNYAFLFAPVFHPGARYIAPIRKELGWRTIFNLLGPLANPVDEAIEARVIGVARRDLGSVFADALRMAGAKKAMVVCGEEELDELSCAGKTLCWRLVETPNPNFRGSSNEEDDQYTESEDDRPRSLITVEAFKLEPADFGLPAHPLSDVSPGKEPHENAEILIKILSGKMPADSPVVDFVLMNVAALLVTSGICEADTSALGEGDDGNVIKERGPGNGRWKEGVRRAKWAIASGAALTQWNKFVEVTTKVSQSQQ